MKIADVDEAARRHGFEALAVRCISMGSMATFRDGAVELRPLSAVLEARSERSDELGPQQASSELSG